MKNDRILECNTCHLKKARREIKRIGAIWRCKKCISKKRWENREYLKRDVLHIRKRTDLVKEWIEKRNLRQLIPKIQGSKDTSRKNTTNYYKGLWLTKIEKDIIYKKYSSLGYSPEEIHKKYEEIRSIFEKMQNKLKEEKKTNEEISNRFKEEFSKLVMEDS